MSELKGTFNVEDANLEARVHRLEEVLSSFNRDMDVIREREDERKSTQERIEKEMRRLWWRQKMAEDIWESLKQLVLFTEKGWKEEKERGEGENE